MSPREEGGSPPCLADVPDERVAEALAELRRAAALLAEAAQVAGATGDPERMSKLDEAAARVRALHDALRG